MFKNPDITIYYLKNGVKCSAKSSCDSFDVTYSYENGRMCLAVEPKETVTLCQAFVKVNYAFPADVRVMPNGYQSWTLTREYKKGEKYESYIKLADITPFTKNFATVSGDAFFRPYPDKANLFHGFTYAYLRCGNEYTLIGSLSERAGYTVLNFDLNTNTITVEKDLEGKVIGEKTVLCDVAVFCGAHDAVFDAYFDAMGIAPCKSPRICGYTSWYNYYTNISEAIAVRDMNALERTGAAINVFQIDDGYQTMVGDWQTCNEKFPKGMKFIADSVHAKGWKAGLWLAPFYAQRKSKVALAHPDWILKDASGKPVFGMLGTRPCYTLDFYIPACAEYIKGFFNTILNEWGFDLVKLDFLYNACTVPRNGKSRGEIMCDAMDFLRECVGEKLILGCGVPLGPAFGKVDYCRIGSDVDLTFKPRFGNLMVARELVSTQTALQNTVFRRGLNGRAFGNDPDVFYLRGLNNESSGSKKTLAFTIGQKLLWAQVCRDFGSILFTSDNAANYNAAQKRILMETYTASARKIQDVFYEGKNLLKVFFEENGENKVWFINYVTGENHIENR